MVFFIKESINIYPDHMSFCFKIFNLRQIRVESYNQIDKKKTKFPVRHHYQADLNLSRLFASKPEVYWIGCTYFDACTLRILPPCGQCSSEKKASTPLWKEHHLAPLAITTFAHNKIPYLKFCCLNLQAQEAQYAAPLCNLDCQHLLATNLWCITFCGHALSWSALSPGSIVGEL
jgi:hypothetical protein